MLWLSCHTLYCHHCQHCHKKYRGHNEEHKMLPFFLSPAWPRRSSWRWPTHWPGNTLMTTTITITQLCTWEGGELCNCKDKPLSIEGGGIHIFDKYLFDGTFVTFPLSRIYQRKGTLYIGTNMREYNPGIFSYSWTLLWSTCSIETLELVKSTGVFRVNILGVPKIL